MCASTSQEDLAAALSPADISNIACEADASKCLANHSLKCCHEKQSTSKSASPLEGLSSRNSINNELSGGSSCHIVCASPCVSFSASTSNIRPSETNEYRPNLTQSFQSQKVWRESETSLRNEHSAQMNQMCRVCGEQAAGFHFGAFTCEGCKSFFGRAYNNVHVVSECKNEGRCIITKKTRTSCKSCRLKKCLLVGMSKSGSRYGRRSNWFKIHYLMQNNTCPSNTYSRVREETPTHSTNINSSIAENSTMPLGTLEAKPHVSSPLKRFKSDEEKSDRPTESVGNSSNSNANALIETRLPISKSTKGENFASTRLFSQNLFEISNLPAVTPRVPAVLSHSPRLYNYMYPYFPSLISAFSHHHYYNKLLQEVKHGDTTTFNEFTVRLFSESVQTLQPPLKELKPNPKSEIRHSRDTCSQNYKLECKQVQNSPKESILESSSSEAHTQENPVDLSLGDKKQSHSNFQLQDCDRKAQRELSSTKADKDTELRTDNINKSEEESPLDLSSTKSI
ncbi:hypothetical protein SK128_000453 [Halocaridina rubra]|uniref:Nuclear receptor domain-containing protein n=1 Tax=Halocaridina rubra TaxID=373956 RepID=A0AAN8XSV0_HALRR